MGHAKPEVRSDSIADMCGVARLSRVARFHGPRSFSHRDALLLRVDELQAKRDLLMAERGRARPEVALMRPVSVDPDMLEELARQSLNYAKPNELILIRE